MSTGGRFTCQITQQRSSNNRPVSKEKYCILFSSSVSVEPGWCGKTGSYEHNQIIVIVVMNSLEKEKKSMPKEAVFNTVKVGNNLVL